MRLKYLIFAGICAALTAVCAQLTIPLAPVPFSLSIVAVFITGAILPKKYAFLTMVIYILMGILGAPVFAKFGGGLSTFVGPTGGYLIAYPIMAFVIAFCCEMAGNKRIFGVVSGMILALVICYAVGSVWLSFATGMTYKKALMAGVVPFILFDSIKIAVSAALSQLLYNAIKKAKIL